MTGAVNTAACFGNYVTETLKKTLPNVISLTLLFIASFQLQKNGICMQNYTSDNLFYETLHLQICIYSD